MNQTLRDMHRGAQVHVQTAPLGDVTQKGVHRPGRTSTHVCAGLRLSHCLTRRQRPPHQAQACEAAGDQWYQAGGCVVWREPAEPRCRTIPPARHPPVPSNINGAMLFCHGRPAELVAVAAPPGSSQAQHGRTALPSKTIHTGTGHQGPLTAQDEHRCPLVAAG